MPPKNINKGLSVDELKALQAKVISGETLTEAEQEALFNAELAAEREENERSEKAKESEMVDRLSSLIAKKLQSGVAADGGAPFIPATPEEVAKLPKQTMAERAEEYYASKNLSEFPWPGIHVTSDLQIFMGHVQGENARDNHVRENTGMKYESFPKPQ